MPREKRFPVNTSKEVEVNPMIFLSKQMFTGRAVENQEARGQHSFVESDTLPTDIQPEQKAILEKMGVVFDKSVDENPIFQYVTLPTGWKKVPTDHSMWSKLVDEKGRERAAIFYKAGPWRSDQL